MSKLYGVALEMSAHTTINQLIEENFAKSKSAPVRHGVKGRPYSKTIGDVANNYLSEFPQNINIAINENPMLISAFISALSANRRALTKEESEYIMQGRDVAVMGEMGGEASQQDIFNRYTVSRRKGESLGRAVYRRYREIKDFVQAEANRSNTTLYIIPERYSIDRNVRDPLTAKKWGAPASLVEFASKNVASIIVTDKLKEYKGMVGVMATITPSVPLVKHKRNFKKNKQKEEVIV